MDLPPIGQPVMTSAYGIVVFVGSDGELVDPDVLRGFYDLPNKGEYIWGRWRLATLDELVMTWPSLSAAQGDRQV